MHENVGRGEKIRTSGPCLPKTVLYQAELHPDFLPNAAGPGRQREVNDSGSVALCRYVRRQSMAYLGHEWSAQNGGANVVSVVAIGWLFA